MHTYIYLFDDLWTGNNKGTLTTGKRSDLFCAGFSPIFLRLLLRRRIVSTWKCIKELCNFVQSSVTVRERVQKQRRWQYQHLVLSTSPHSVFLFYKMVQSGGRGPHTGPCSSEASTSQLLTEFYNSKQRVSSLQPFLIPICPSACTPNLLVKHFLQYSTSTSVLTS